VVTDARQNQDDPRAPTTLVVAIVGAVLVFAIIVALQAFFYRSEEAERSIKYYAQAPEELARLRAQEQEQLNSYHWVDPARGVVSIPIDRAMELVVRDQGRNPSAAGPASTPSDARPAASTNAAAGTGAAGQSAASATPAAAPPRK
jgi:hypothetical protein